MKQTVKASEGGTIRSRGAQLGNSNGVRSGINIPKGFDLGRTPRRFRRIKTDVETLRERLTADYLANGGYDGVFAQAQLQEVSRQELRAKLLLSWLTTEFADLSIDQRVMLLREMASATNGRNRVLKEMGLHSPGASVPQNLQDALSRLESPSGENGIQPTEG